MATTEKVTILIPTLNRSEYLARALKYYDKQYFPGEIIIGDSSDENHVAVTQKALAHLSIKVNYHYLSPVEYPNDGFAIKKMLEFVQTPYVVMSGDDDFLVPASLGKCAEFLDGNPEYVAAYGLRCNIFYRNNTGRMESGYFVQAVEFLSADPVQRWTDYMRTGLATQNYVHRTEIWKRMYDRVPEMGSRYIGPELLPCSLTAILGMTKRLDTLHFVFQKGNDKIVDFDKTSLFSMINKPEWAQSVDVFRDEIIRAFIEKGVPEKKATEAFDREFFRHVLMVMQSQYMLQHEGREHEYQNQLFTTMLNPMWQFYPDFRQINLVTV